MTHIPQCPENWVLDYIKARWVVLPGEGIVIGSRGREIGYEDAEGYVYVAVNKPEGGIKAVRRTHLVWYAHTGNWPDQEIDHEDRKSTNDKVGNLRLSTRQGNNENRMFKASTRTPKHWTQF